MKLHLLMALVATLVLAPHSRATTATREIFFPASEDDFGNAGAWPRISEEKLESVLDELIAAGDLPPESKNHLIATSYSGNVDANPATTFNFESGDSINFGGPDIPLPGTYDSMTIINADGMPGAMPSTVNDPENEGDLPTWNMPAMCEALGLILWHEMCHASETVGGGESPANEYEDPNNPDPDQIEDTCEHLALAKATREKACARVGELCAEAAAAPPEEKAELKLRAKALCEAIKFLQDEFNDEDSRAKADACASGGVSGYPGEELPPKLVLGPPPTAPPAGQAPTPWPVAGCDACDLSCFDEEPGNG